MVVDDTTGTEIETRNTLVLMYDKIKVKSKYLLEAYSKRIRTVQCGYMQIE